MNAFRRGWIGLALFFSALVLMPLLVVKYQNGDRGATELTAAAPSGIFPGVPAPGTSPAAHTGSGARTSPGTRTSPGAGAGAGHGAGAGTSPTPAAETARPTGRPPGSGTLVGFAGVTEGETIRGFRQITLTTTGDVGPVRFVLTGPTGARYNVPSAGPPYAFAPHRTGWETSAVVDGPYSLEALTDTFPSAPVTVRFWVNNNAPPAGGR